MAPESPRGWCFFDQTAPPPAVALSHTSPIAGKEEHSIRKWILHTAKTNPPTITKPKTATRIIPTPSIHPHILNSPVKVMLRQTTNLAPFSMSQGMMGRIKLSQPRGIHPVSSIPASNSPALHNTRMHGIKLLSTTTATTAIAAILQIMDKG